MNLSSRVTALYRLSSMSKKIVCEMNRFECSSDNEVIYLVPCVKKLTASLLNCTSKTHIKLLNICETKGAAVNIPSALLKDCNSHRNENKSCQKQGNRNSWKLDNPNSEYAFGADTSSELATNNCLLHVSKREHFADTIATPLSQNYSHIKNSKCQVPVENFKPDLLNFLGSELPLLDSVQEEQHQMSGEPPKSISTSFADKADNIIHNETFFSPGQNVSSEEFKTYPGPLCNDMPGDSCSVSDIQTGASKVQMLQSFRSMSVLKSNEMCNLNTSLPVEMEFSQSLEPCLLMPASVPPLLSSSEKYFDQSLRCDLGESFQDRGIQNSSDCNDMSCKESITGIIDADCFSCDVMEITKNDVNENVSLVMPIDSNMLPEMSEFEALLLNPSDLEVSNTANKINDKSHSTAGDFVVTGKADPLSFAGKQQLPVMLSDSDDLGTIDGIISDVGDILDEYQFSENGPSSTVITDSKLHKDYSPATCLTDHSSCNEIPGNLNLTHCSDVGTCNHLLINNNSSKGKTEIKNGNVPVPNQDIITPVVENTYEFCNTENLFDDLMKPEEESENKMSFITRTSDLLNRLFSENNCCETSPTPSTSSEDVKPNLQKTGLGNAGIPTKVAFKVRPAGKPGKYYDKGRIMEKLAQNVTKVSAGGRNRRAKNNFNYRLSDAKCIAHTSYRFHWELEKNKCTKNVGSGESRFSSVFSYRCFQPGYSKSSQNELLVKSCSSKQEVRDFILPMSTSGLSITLPDTMQRNVKSFVPDVGDICKASSLISYNQDSFASRLVSSSPNIQCSLGGSTASFSSMQCGNPDLKNVNGLSTSTSETTVTSLLESVTPVKSFIALRNGAHADQNVASTRTTACKALSMRTPTSSCSENKEVTTMNISLSNLITESDNLKTKALGTPQSVSIGKLNSVTCQQGKKDVHLVASEMLNIESASSAKDSTTNESKLSETIKISVRTKPVQLPTGNEKILNVRTKDENSMQEQDVSTDVNRGSHFSVSDLNSVQDSMKKIPKNKHLGHELKVHFPNVPESILQQLTIPPQALHRGYLTTNDLQNIRTQALKLHLGIIYRNHVSKCTTCRCEICHTFVVQQGSLSWTAREKLFNTKKQSRGAKNGQSKFKTKIGRRCNRNRLPIGEEDDPTYEPPLSYFNAWKRKSSNICCETEQLKMPKAENNFAAGKMPECYVLLNNIWQVENINKKNCNFTRQPISKYNTYQTKNECVSKNSMHSCEDEIVEHDVKINCHLQSGKSAVGKTFKNWVPENACSQNFETLEEASVGRSSAAKLHLELDGGCNNSGVLQEWQRSYRSPDNLTSKDANDENAFNIDSTSSSIAHSNTPKSTTDSQTVLHTHALNGDVATPPTLHLDKGCSCSGSCRIMECPCARAGVLCLTGHCSCNTCDNPLNILHEFKLDVHLARVDECLMQNLYCYNVEDLHKLLSSDITVPCCRTSVKLQYIIPSTVICNSCGIAVSYSWCLQSIHVQTLYPRNHCLVCCSCKPSFHTHCQMCRLCTPSLNQGTCSECGTAKLFDL